VPAVADLVELAGALLPDEDVEAVAGAQPRGAARRDRLVLADDDVHHRVARQREIAHARARDRVALPDLVLEHLGTEAPDRAELRDRPRQGRLVRGGAQHARQRLDRRPLHERREQHREEDDVEELLAAGHAVDHRKGGEHDRHRAAQAGGREHRALPLRHSAHLRRDERGEGPGHDQDDERKHRPLEGDVRQAAGEDEQPQREEHPHLRDPREPLVERDHGQLRRDRRGAEREPGQVHREEAGAVQRSRR
jgi:hypothetical protein